jgi:hypothetical protein
VEAARKKRRPLPQWYLDEPEAVEGVGFLSEAFRDLATCRHSAEGPIPWDAVALYADKAELDPDMAVLLWSVIRAMDQAERRWVVEDMKLQSSINRFDKHKDKTVDA